MNLMQWLNKLGIVRWGSTAATYRNAKERPIELQMPGVLNAERDLMNPSPAKSAGESKPTKDGCCGGCAGAKKSS